jgi:heat shock protein HtpX
MVLIAVAIAILAPLAARLLYFACSRQREYLADAAAAQYTRYPYGLASALEKISGHMNPKVKPNRALAPLFIVNPLQARSAVGLFSTHPATDRRVKILRSMGGMAGFADYESAYRKVTGKGSGLLGSSVLKSAKSVPAREAAAEAGKKKDAMERAREVTDLLDRMVQFLLIPCMCGVRIKVPQGFNRDTIPCPRCGRKHPVPRAESAEKIVGGPGKDKKTLQYHRQGKGWESFKCSCGKTIQISPAFDSDTVKCHGCKRNIVVN